MRDSTTGRFLKGSQLGKATQFKKNHHWRSRQKHWEKEWLHQQYVTQKMSAQEIASQCGVTHGAILYWLDKHGIKRRNVSEARSVKHWALYGKDNPAFGKVGPANPNYRGGTTPWRQSIYASRGYRKFRRDVWKRDKGCRLCPAKKGEARFHIHHIIMVAEAPMLILDPDNAILLCEKCHIALRGKERRWENRLFRLIGVIK